MPKPLKSTKRSALTVKIGRWFEASATGWGVAAIPLVLALALLALVAKLAAG
jgi:hypothetical protein